MAGALVLRGAYLAPNARTRVRVGGRDLGWHALDKAPAIALPMDLQNRTLEIELEHETPHSPAPAEPRLLAFFLKEVSVRSPPGTTP
jgi:hypothetical protein